MTFAGTGNVTSINDEVTAKGLKNALHAYRLNKSETSSQHLITALDAICASLCFGDEIFIRRLSVDRYATVLVSTLTTVSAVEDVRLRTLTVQTLALLADLVPRGGSAIASAKGIPPLLRLLQETKPDGNEALLEELLKCIGHVTLEANVQMVRENAIAILTTIEADLNSHHLRMICLKCLCHLLSSVRREEWHTYLAKPCGMLFSRFHNKVYEILKDERGDSLEQRLPRESELYLLRLIECITLVFDRLLHTKYMIEKNMDLVEEAVSALVTVLKRTAYLGSQAVGFRDAVCSSLLTIFLTDTSIGVKLFLKYHVVQTICGIITTLLEYRMKRLPQNGVDLAEALLGNDVSAIPCIAEEQQVIPFLEFLLVFIPSALVAHDSDYYITIPHYVWEWEDDFHNRSDCNENLSKQLEREYIKQRRFSSFVPYELQLSTRTLKVDFDYMQYMSNEHLAYPHTLYRHPILVGYMHRRVMRCTCDDNSWPYNSSVYGVDKQESSFLRSRPKWRENRHTDDNSISGTTTTAAAAPVAAAVVGGLTGNEMVMGGGGGGEEEEYFSRNRRISSNAIPLETVNSLPYSSTLDRERLVNVPFCCCSKMYMRFCEKRKNKSKKMNKRNKKGLQSEQGGKNYEFFCREALRDVREEILRGSSTRSQFLQGTMIQVLITWCLPALVTVIKRSVSPIIARHSSVLILRSVDLVAEYLRVGHRNFHNESQGEIYDKLTALTPQLGTVISYLVTTNSLPTSLTAGVCPFREFQCDTLFVRGLVYLGLKMNSRVPAMSLTCETQMNALSTFLLLYFLFQGKVKIFTDTQQLLVFQKLESVIGSVSPHQSTLRTALYGSTGMIPCPFHGTSEIIEVVHQRMSEQVYILLREETEKRFINPLNPSGEVSSTILGIMNSKNGYSTNPLETRSTHSTSSCLSQSIIADINNRAEAYMEYSFGVQYILAIYDYMKDNGNDLSSLVYGNSEFVANLAETLHKNSEYNNILLDEKTKESFIGVRESLERVINEHTGLVNVELASAIEREPTRFARRFRRSKVMMTMSDRMWTPLNIKLEPISMEVHRGQPLLPSSRNLFISGKNRTILSCGIEQNVFSVLPTTPLNYIAKYILFQLQQQYAAGPDKKRSQSLIGRRLYNSENNDLDVFYNMGRLLISEVEVRETEDEISPSFPSIPRMTAVVMETAEQISSPLRLTPFPLQVEDSECERILSVVSTTVPVAGQISNGFPQGSNRTVGDKVLLHQDNHNSSSCTITVDNIIFFCNGEPVTDLSTSVLELCCNSSQTLATLLADMEKGEVGYGEESSQTLQRILTLCSAMHSIRYVIVKEPLVWGTNGEEEEVIEEEEEKRWERSYCYPKDVFGRLCKFTGVQYSLGAAAKLLDELWNVLNMAEIKISHEEGRLCSALIHGFYNHLTAFMLPPLDFPILLTCLNGQKDQHLAGYILWTYPQVFSFNIRRILLHLLLSVRRVPTPALIRLKEAAQRRGCVIPLHGLEWVTPDLNINGTKKVIVQRNNILESGAKVLRSYVMCPLPLNVEFENENGVGVGPALEFYNLLSAKLQEESLQMWRTEEYTDASGATARRVQIPLFPAASQTMMSLSYFELLGLLVGRVLMEERVVDLPLHPCFVRGILGQLDENQLAEIDPQLHWQLLQLETLPAAELAACGLFFVLPDGDVELCRGGAQTPVVAANVSAYVRAVRRHFCVRRLMGPLRHFLQGLRYTVVPPHLRLFTAAELQLMIAGPDGPVWPRPEDLARDLIPAHGYDARSPVLHALRDVVGSWDAKMQRAFLRFVTGSTRIPQGGLQPPITVVRRSEGTWDERYWESVPLMRVEERGMAQLHQQQHQQLLMDESLPTVNTCAHYLKLPSYSSKAILEEKLRQAVMEGQECFLLT
ncbi:ubiquitin-protein ligase [Trypanosoma theileri]|uniref:HECT-type E3 ubiquitin transferase n=1 Tax=Trypanosoma theileri TaxID=67003 RepID=A0A1X0P0K1_9TRYP|nr:ubiquitin-protein ligase [Trypanosoma theileri]ORC90371.1 ubiquitin-protein ligase [Trypanosoma theileri]